MKLRIMTAAALLAFTTGTAFAMHCPADMKKIDAALAGMPPLSKERLSEVAGALRRAGATANAPTGTSLL